MSMAVAIIMSTGLLTRFFVQNSPALAFLVGQSGLIFDEFQVNGNDLGTK